MSILMNTLNSFYIHHYHIHSDNPPHPPPPARDFTGPHIALGDPLVFPTCANNFKPLRDTHNTFELISFQSRSHISRNLLKKLKSYTGF